jgi:anion-transporting  ArsA/GET3 family ATPase
MWQRDEYDLIVVDTPPAQHALDFLEAPQRLIEFLESRLVQMLIHPAFAAGRFGFRLFQQATRRVLNVLERVSGIGFLQDISEFLLAFEGMSAGFRQRAMHVRTLLLGPESAFVLVTGPGGESVRQAMQFRERLETYGAPLAGVLVNRVRLWPGGVPPSVLEAGAAADPADLAALAAALADACGSAVPAAEAAQAAHDAAKGYAALARRDARATQTLRDLVEAEEGYWGQIPEFPDDVHDLAGLAQIARAICGEEDSPGGEET